MDHQACSGTTITCAACNLHLATSAITGGAGSQTQVRVRGAEANQVLVLMDGVRANDPAASGEFQYQFALASNIERIEIIRGPQSATWGSDAMAGVINIIRKKDVINSHLSGDVEYGSFDTISAGVNGGYTSGNVEVSGGVSYLNTDGTNISRVGRNVSNYNVQNCWQL